jgi:hypothetical protein
VWKIWLEYMLDVLEADWKAVSEIHSDKNSEKKKADFDAAEDMYRNCILVHYVSEGAKSSTGLRRIVKSILADGSVDALKAYPEVFKDETREGSVKTGTKRKRDVKLNLDEDDYGDYLQDEDDEDVTPAPSQSGVSSPTTIDDSSNVPSIASINEDPEALIMRLRLLALVSSHIISHHSSFNKISSRLLHLLLRVCLSQSESSIKSTLKSSSLFHCRHSHHSYHHLQYLICLL